jgi:WD40 repeat protein
MLTWSQQFMTGLLRMILLTWIGLALAIGGVLGLRQLFPDQRPVLMVVAATANQPITLYTAAVNEPGHTAPYRAIHPYSATWWTPVWAPDGRQFVVTTGLGPLLINPVSWRTARVPGASQFAGHLVWSPEGTRLVYSLGDTGALVLADLVDQSARPLTGALTVVGAPTWSPDGSRLAFFARQESVTNLYVLTVATGAVDVLAADINGTEVQWSPAPESTLIAYVAEDRRLTIINADSGTRHPLINYTRRIGQLTWSPDGRFLAFAEIANPLLADVYLIEVADGEVLNVSDHPGSDNRPAWSPDGRWLAFRSTRGPNSARWGLYGLYLPTGQIHNLAPDMDEVYGFAWWP